MLQKVEEGSSGADGLIESVEIDAGESTVRADAAVLMLMKVGLPRRG